MIKITWIEQFGPAGSVHNTAFILCSANDIIDGAPAETHHVTLHNCSVECASGLKTDVLNCARCQEIDTGIMPKQGEGRVEYGKPAERL